MTSIFALFFAIFGFTSFAFGADSPGSEYRLPEISVLGGAMGGSAFDALPSVSKTAGQKLEKKKKSTLGETLSNEAGVSSTFFGPNSSRPVIRGLDGDRIRILENGIGLLDASGASPDHAVSIDPLLIESVEILRGPSALLYGSTATGGVVNIKTNRIAETPLTEGITEVRAGASSVDAGRTIGALSRYRLGDFVLHVDASYRKSDDYSVPAFARTAAERAESPQDPEEFKRVTNSGNKALQGAIGVSRPFRDGHIGMAVSGYQSEYGTVQEKEVTIDMDRVRVDASGELRRFGFLDSIRFKSAFTKYEHTEHEGDEVETIFGNRGIESRVDAKVDSLFFGLQHQYFKLSASGKGAFLPTTRNSSLGVFALKEAKWGRFTPSAGIRLESNGVASEQSSNADFNPAESKNFFAPSASLGVQYQIPKAESSTQDWILGLHST